MADLRIVDAPEIPTENITGKEKLPTGGNGNYSISLDSLADYTKTKKDLADNASVDGKVNGVRQELDAHIEDLLNPHQVTKGQIGLGNVDNTADADKPVSNSTQASIISAVAPKADKSYVDNQLTLKANKSDVYTKSKTYTKQESGDLVNNSISSALTPVNSSLDLAKRGVVNRYDSSLTYNSGERVVLTNGDIVKSLVNGNANDPNVDMTGWVKTGNVITVDSIADMTAITNHQNGDVTIAKHYDKSTGRLKGGGIFIYDSSKASLNDGGTVFNGWVRQYEGVVDVFMFGAQGFTYENPNIDDTQPIQKAVDTAKNVYIPQGMFKCNLVFTNSFNIQGAGKGTFLLPYDSSKPVMTNINRASLGWNNDTVMDLEIRSLGFNDKNFTGTGFQYGLFPAQEGYAGVGRVVMRNVRIQGFDKGIHKVNGNIGNKYYDCSFEYNKYHVYGKGNQLSLGNPNAALMHCGCDYFYGCNFSESTIAAVAYYDTSGGSGQWAFDNCVFQFNKGFAWFFEFDLPNGLDLFAPITSNNTWFESNASDTVVIDRLDGTTATMQSKVRSVIGADSVVMTVTDEFNTRVSVGLANPQSQLHIHDKETPSIQLTSDLSGNDSPNLGAVIYHNTQDLYLENKQTGIVYILNQNGRVELNASGDLTSNKGKIGYGYGAGNDVTQTGNKDVTVTCNSPSGRIITSAQSLGAGEMKTFILNNSYIGENDVLVANVRFSPSNNAKYYDIKVTNISNGSCQINIKNSNSVALGEAIEISFCIIAGTQYHY